MPPQKDYVQLTPEGMDYFRVHGFPNARQLFHFIRKVRGKEGGEHFYVALKNGGSVPRSLTVELSEYLLQVQGVQLSLDELFVTAAPPAKTVKKPPIIADPWRWGWETLLAYYRMPLRPDDDASIDPQQGDFEKAAKMALEFVGRSHHRKGKKLSVEEAIARGEEVMERKAEAYAEWMRKLWVEQPFALLFTVLDGLRLGLWVIVPLKQTSYESFRKGEFEDSEFQPSDYDYHSNYLFMHMNTEPIPASAELKKRLSLAQIGTMAYQLAMLLPTIKRSGPTPSILAIAGTDENEKRLKLNGFTKLRTVTPRSRKPLYEMISPTEARKRNQPTDFLHRKRYDAMWTLIRLYQGAFADHRDDAELD